MKIPSLTGVIFLVASLNTQISGFPWRTNPSSLIHESVEVELLEDPSHHANHRHARHAQTYDVMPSKLHFRLRFGGRDVSLRLARNTVGAPSDSSKRGLADFPLFVIEDGQIRRKQIQRDDNVDLYSNETTGSSFVVRKSSNRTQFILEGIFYDGLDQLQLTRDPRGGLHRIHKQTREVDFQDDYVNTIINEGVTPSTDGSTRPPPIYKSHARAKRQLDTGGEHEIRLFMVADYKDYKTWLKYYNNNSTLTELEMNLYYAFVANSISVRYSSVHTVDSSFSLDVVVTGLLIVNSKPVSSWTEENTLKTGSSYVDASKALDAFGQWVKTKNVELPLSDHWMLFTGFDIYINRNPHVAGLAKLGGMCALSSISIIEQDNTGSVGATAAHELGHSLGSLHDGEEKDCLDEDNFIMSKKLKTPDDDKSASRPWQFSVCSVRAFKRFVSNVDCTRKSSRGHNMLSTSLSPGQVFTADKQCQLALGNGSYFGRRLQYQEGYSSMCRRMFCSVPQVPGLYQSIFTMEKTSCGDKKWCQRGKCEAHVDAPSMEDNCPQGDDPTAPCVQEDCRYYTPHTKTVYCCHTCRGKRPIWEDLVSSFAGDGEVLRMIGESPVASKADSAQTLPSKQVTTARDDISNATTTGPSIMEALALSNVELSSPPTIDPSQPSRAATTVVPQSIVTDADVPTPGSVGVPKDGATEGARVDHGMKNVTMTSLEPLSGNGVPPAPSQEVTTANLILTLNRLDGLSQVTSPTAFQTDSKASPPQVPSLNGLSVASSSSSSSGATLLDSGSESVSSSLTNLTIPKTIGNAEKLNPDQNFVILQNSTAPVRFASRHQGLNMVTYVTTQPDTGDQSKGEEVSLNIVADLKDRARSLGGALDNKSSPGEHGVVVSLPVQDLEVFLRSREKFDQPLIPQSSYITPAVDDESILSTANQNKSKTSLIHSNLGPNLNGTLSQLATQNKNGKLTESVSDRLLVNTSKNTSDMTSPPTTISTSTSSQSENSQSNTRATNPLPDTRPSDQAVIATYPSHVEHASQAIPTVSDIDLFLDPIIPFTLSQLSNRIHGIDILRNRHESNTISYNLQVPTVASPSEIPNFYQDDFPVATNFRLADATPKTDSDSRADLPSALNADELLPRTNSGAQANRWRSTGNAPAIFGNSSPYNFDTADTVDYVVDYLVPHEVTSTLQRTPTQKDSNKEYLYAANDQQSVSDKQQQLLQSALRNLMTNRIRQIDPSPEKVSRPPASVSYPGDLNRFLEELSSSQTSSTFAPTTAENDGPTVFPKCRFQCVFYREPSNGPPVLLDEIGRYLMASIRRFASSPNMNSAVLSHLFRHAAFQTNITNSIQRSGYLPDSLLRTPITVQDTLSPKVTILRDSILPKVNKLQHSLLPQTTTLQESKGTTLQDSLLPKVSIVQDSLFQKAATLQGPVLPKVPTFQNFLLPKLTSLPDYRLQKTTSLQGTIGSKVTTISQNTDSEKQMHADHVTSG